MQREIVDLKIAGNVTGSEGPEHERDTDLWRDFYLHLGELMANPKYGPLRLMIFATALD